MPKFKGYMTSFDPKELSTAKLHSYLLSAIAPRPIAFASTIDENSLPNLSPFSFFNVFSANPPILIFSPARRVRNNTNKHTLQNAMSVKEVVINVVNYDIVQQMSLSSSEYDKEVNEFEKSGLTMLKSDIVKPFRVAESPIQFECKVNDIIVLGSQGGAGNLIICEVVKLHINPDFLDKNGTIDQTKLDLVARAGGNYYTRANQGFFEIPKPIKPLGIGVDAIPKEIRNSTVLTGNDLGKLGNVETLPTAKEINEFIKDIGIKTPYLLTATIKEKHKKAKDYLKKNDVNRAWKLLLS